MVREQSLDESVAVGMRSVTLPADESGTDFRWLQATTRERALHAAQPAAYAALAANEAEKAADINILEVRAVGSFGRVYIGGEERDVVVAHEAATQAIEAVTGTKKK